MLVRGSSKAATPPEYKSEQGQNNKGARKQEYSFLFFRFWFLFGFLLIPGNVNVYERSTLKLMLHIAGWQTQQPIIRRTSMNNAMGLGIQWLFGSSSVAMVDAMVAGLPGQSKTS